MTVNGGLPAPGTQTISTNNPAGGVPAPHDPQPAPVSPNDLVVTTNALGAYTSVNRPSS